MRRMPGASGVRCICERGLRSRDIGSWRPGRTLKRLRSWRSQDQAGENDSVGSTQDHNMAAETKTIRGSCLCQRISYTAQIPSEGPVSANRCNCAWCRKRGLTNYRLFGPDAFKLLTPPSQSEVCDYPSVSSKKGGSAHRYFCSTCGVHVWMEAEYMLGEQKVEMFSINLATVDEGIELSEVKIVYVDGKNDGFMNWGEKPWKGGLV